MRVTLVLTHQCNLACTYCYAGEKSSRSMADEVAWKALRLAFSGPPGEEVDLGFFGGEPMLRFPELARFTRLAVRMARKSDRRVRFQVTSNATVLEAHHLDFLARHRFRVALSLDGLGEDHDRLRPFASGRASSALVRRNVELAARSLPHLEVLVVTSPQNLGSLVETCEDLRRLGVARVALLPNVDFPWGPEDRERLVRVYHALARRALLWLEDPRPLVLEPFARRYQPPVAAVPCRFGDGEVAVAPSGNLYPCARLVGADLREEIRVGTVDGGVCRDRARDLAGEADRRMASCRSDGACRCVAWMPGDLAPQIERYRMFCEIADDAARAARQFQALEVL